MKRITVILILTLTAFLFPQSKYYIYFKDKGDMPAKVLSKTSSMKQEALKLLSLRSIERREKVMGTDHILTYEDMPLDAYYVMQLEQSGIKIENKLRWFNAVTAYLSPGQVSSLAALPFVKSVKPVIVFKFNKINSEQKTGMNKISAFPEKIDYGHSYIQEKLSDIPIVHSKGINGSGVLVGILDDGFMWRDHESLVSRKVEAEYNFVFHTVSTAPQPGDALDSGVHGTYVFSIIGGYKDSTIIGVAYNATFVLAKTEDDRSEKHIEEDNYAAALQWMDSLGVDITTSSLGYNIFDTGTNYTYADMNGNTTIVTKAAELAYQRGILVLNAAGNEGDTKWKYVDAPADGFHVIAVGSVDSTNAVSAFSSRGPTYDGRIKPDVVAMGEAVFGAYAPSYDSYVFEQGTSAATPIAGGVAALLLSAYPNLTNAQARYILLRTAGNYNTPNNDRGYGLISAERALSYPNLYFNSGSNIYTLNKIFFNSSGIVPSSVKVHYSLDNQSFSEGAMSYDGKIKYSFDLPAVPDSQLVYAYFTYQDSSGGSDREPSTQYYSFKIGQYDITVVDTYLTELSKKVLETNFPNPFNSSTTIYFYSDKNVPAKLIIMDAIGQTVKVLFKGIAEAGKNTCVWNGKNDRGVSCASGVYYYILTINGKDYGNKMVLVK